MLNIDSDSIVKLNCIGLFNCILNINALLCWFNWIGERAV